MRIVAWNIRAGGGRRVPAILRALARWRPDVVALSEFRATAPSRALAAALAERGLAHQAARVDPEQQGRNGLLVASRWPLGRLRARADPASQGATTRWLAVRVHAPAPFDLGAVHVPNRASGLKYPFLDAVLQCARLWRRRRGLIVGDTNTGLPGIDEESPAFNRTEAAWMHGLGEAGWADTFRHLHGQRRAYTWYSPNGDNGFRIDQAFASPALLPAVERSEYRWAGGNRRAGVSDHAAVRVDLAPGR